MFRLLDNAQPELIELCVDSKLVTVPGGISVAAALLYLGISSIRKTTISQSSRAPYCMMGVCFECLMEIDGESNQRACQVIVHQGMQVNCQRGAVDCGGVS